MIDASEIKALAEKYGQPLVNEQDIEADKYLFESRSYRARTRRGEVVMVIEREPGMLLLHTKSWYKPPVMRLLTGGIDVGEPVEEALLRELREETNYPALDPIRFLALHRCHLHHQDKYLAFDSLHFQIQAPASEPVLKKNGEDIFQFKWISVDNLPEVAAELRATPKPRQAWGEWRARSHDLVFEILSR